MQVAEIIKQKLEKAFSPISLVINDDSEKHRGHAGHSGKGESHFSVEIVSAAFIGLPQIKRHKMVNQVLAEELSGPVHALSLKTRVPDEG